MLLFDFYPSHESDKGMIRLNNTSDCKKLVGYARKKKSESSAFHFIDEQDKPNTLIIPSFPTDRSGQAV